MGTPKLPRDLPEALAANRDELRRRSRAERIHPIWLWTGVVVPPLAFALVRIASVVLVSRGCGARHAAGLLGLSSPQLVTGAITLVGGAVTLAAGLISWRIWRQTSLPSDEVTAESMPRVPFWALGGVLLSAFFLLAIAFTGGLALVLSTGCP